MSRARIEARCDFPLRDVFDVPDLSTTNDDIVNGVDELTHPTARGRWRPSPRSGSIIRWRGCRITPRPSPSISRTTCCSPTTSSTWTSSSPSAAGRWPIRPPATRRLVEPGQCRDHQPRRRQLAHRRQAAADADLSPEARGAGGHHAGQHRRRPVQRQDGDRPYRGPAPPCLADGRPLRRPAELASGWAITFWPMPICARITCWTTICRSGCRSRRWRRSRWRWRMRWRRSPSLRATS